MLNLFCSIARKVCDWFSTRSRGDVAEERMWSGLRDAHNEVHETFFSGVRHRNPINADAEHDDPVTLAPWQTEAEERIAKIVERRRAGE